MNDLDKAILVQQHQTQLELDYVRYNRYITKENKRIQRENEHNLKTNKRIMVGMDTGCNPARPIYGDTVEPEPLMEEASVPKIVEVVENSNGLDIELVLEGGSSVFIHRTATVEQEEAERIKTALAYKVAIANIDKLIKEEYINKPKREKAMNDFIDAMGEVVAQFRTTGKAFIDDKSMVYISNIARLVAKNKEPSE